MKSQSPATAGIAAALPAAFTAAAILLFASCESRDPAPEEAPAPPAEVEPVRELTPDERLAEQVRQAMLQAPALNREDIKIAVVQNQVFLTGQVAAPHLRDEAVAIAGEVPGVRAVHSKISVGRAAR